MKVSEKGLEFLAAHEGFVSRGYLDPAGVVTIGYGFTMRSRVFSTWWMATKKRKLRVNDTLSSKDANMLLIKLLSEEYVPPVQAAFGRLPQHQVDGCTSVGYNLGSRAFKWKWAKALQANMVARSAALLRVTGTTAAGQTLAGLVRRRGEEADLIEKGIYGSSSALNEVSTQQNAPNPDVEEAQELLINQGIDANLDIDGWMGPKTGAAVLAYQKLHPHLLNDGKLGTATLNQLRKDAGLIRDAGKKVAKQMAPVVSGGGLVSWFVDLPWLWITAGVAAAMVLVFVWHRRDVLGRRFNKLAGREHL